MNINELECYLNGLLDTASSVSVQMGRSYVRALVFDNAGFEEEFRKTVKLELNGAVDHACASFADFICEWFGNENGMDKKISSSLIYHIEGVLGQPEKLLLLNEKCFSAFEKRNSPVPFTFVENAAAVEFEKYTVCFVMGNNE